MNISANSDPAKPDIVCPVCRCPLDLRLARGRKSGKPFIMLVCARDGRHFRGFINHRPFVEEVFVNLEGKRAGTEGDNS